MKVKLSKKVLTVVIAMLFAVLLLCMNNNSVLATDGMPGARSATSEQGDVFLGGNYIEVGISKSGSFGTSTSAPASFNSHALSQYNYKLGLISDGDGWDVGEPPTSGDFFLPGTPYEGYVLEYKIGSQTYSYTISERTEQDWESKAISGPKVEDKSDIENGILKAVFSVVTKENVKVELTYQFGINDKYYSTVAKITNQGSEKITNVVFKRDLDPDNDKDLNNTFDTYNKVACNPDVTKEGKSALDDTDVFRPLEKPPTSVSGEVGC